MPLPTRRSGAWALLLAGGLLAGCGDADAVVEPEPPTAGVEAAVPSERPEAEAANLAQDQSTVPAAERVAENAEGTSSAVAEAPRYEPPFPDRVDLFSPPRRQVSDAQSGETGEGSVMLLGFIRVDRERAVLAFDGQSISVAEGETQYGVEVVSIRPPAVVLQRGRQRWQTTLND
jgi:hypothetical protein